MLTRSHLSGLRRGALGAGVLSIGVAMVALTQCTETQRDLGQGCLRNVDCVSGYCAGQICVAPPPVFDAIAPFDAGVDAAIDASDSSLLDAAADAHDATPADVGMPHDTGAPPKDTGSDVPADREAGAPLDAAAEVGVDAAKLHDAGHDVTDAPHTPG